jgi:hypothetical protein
VARKDSLAHESISKTPMLEGALALDIVGYGLATAV